MTQPIRISRNTPLPPNPERPGRVQVYPWPDMQHGDSIHVVGDQAIKTARASAAYYRRKNPGRKVVSRKEGKGVRMWMMISRKL